MWFSVKKIGALKQYANRKDLVNRRFLLKTIVVAGAIFLIIFAAKWVFAYVKKWANAIGVSSTRIISQQLWEPMEVDELWNINALIVWYSWIDDWGGFLTDTIMVASMNPKLWAVTFLSIPRDLYVDYNEWYKWRINWLYWSKFLATEWDEDIAAKALAKKVGEVTGLDVPYYMMVDFEWFTNFIDELDGIEVDVKEPIFDPYYPWPNNGYQTFQIAWWVQVLSGDIALKYARSRQTTSDFSRTLRQQQIIKWVIKKIIWQVWTLNVTKLQDTYTTFDEMVITNVSMKQMLWVIPTVEAIEHYFSFVYTADCDLRYLDLTTPWCVLRHGDRSNFWWAAVVIPEWASYYNLSYYKKTQDFAFWVTHHQEFLMERAKIGVFNGMDKQVARAAWYNVNGVASQLALDLKIRGFDVVDIDNTEEFFDKTVLYLPWYGWYPATVDMLKAFIDINEIRVDETGEYSSGGATLILWQDYVKKL